MTGRLTMRTGAVIALMIAGPGLAEPGRYPSPDDAITAMIEALEARDRVALMEVFGPENEDVVSTGNSEEDRMIWGDFLRDFTRVHRIDLDDNDRATLLTGRNLSPFPIALVRSGRWWSFDVEEARDEILMRRIGGNELAVIAVMTRAGEVQEIYRRVDHDGDGVMEFAASLLSTHGNRDGLYWPDEAGGGRSPYPASIGRANLGGYSVAGSDFTPEPWDGYYFRILQEQGPAAPGGAYSYMVNGNMVAGHALLAVPAAYEETGIMSFMVGENGKVYEADLGPDSLDIAFGITRYDPDDSWSLLDIDAWK